MNYGHTALAALGGVVAYFAVGTAIFFLVPQLIGEARKYPEVFRSKESQMAGMPMMMVSTLVAIFVVAVMYCMTYQGGSGLVEGARFGALIGAFVVCAFVIHNYVNFNFGRTLMRMQAVAYFVQWTAVGTVIGVVYKAVG